jgi:hypothetical protein
VSRSSMTTPVGRAGILTRRLAAVDPALGMPDPDLGPDSRAISELNALLALPVNAPVGLERPGSHRTARRTLAAAGIAGVVAAGVYFGTAPGTARQPAAYAATPTPLAYAGADGVSGKAELLRLAAIARTQPELMPKTYYFGRTHGWSLAQTPVGQPLPTRIEAASVTFTDKVLRHGGAEILVQPDPPPFTYGATIPPGYPNTQAEADVMAGTDQAAMASGPWLWGTYSDDPIELASTIRWLERFAHQPYEAGTNQFTEQMPGESISDRLATWRGIGDLLLARRVPPAVLAALWSIAADLPGVQNLGTVVDRDGRRGIGFALQSDNPKVPISYRIIVDESTGQLLGTEQVLTAPVAGVAVKIPGVIAYRDAMELGYVAIIPRDLAKFHLPSS